MSERQKQGAVAVWNIGRACQRRWNSSEGGRGVTVGRGLTPGAATAAPGFL